jgi:hypothetical protein
MVLLPKLGDFSQTTLDSASEVIPLGQSGSQFIFVALPDLCGSLRQFGLEARPYLLVLVIVPVLEQAEGFFRAELCYTGEVLDSEAI